MLFYAPVSIDRPHAWNSQLWSDEDIRNVLVIIMSHSHMLRCLCIVQGPDQCDACQNAQLGPYGPCTDECPKSFYTDDMKVCRPCSPNCLFGCTGPANRVGEGGCRCCDVVIYEADTSYCGVPESVCPSNFYSRTKKDDYSGSRYLVRT